MGKCSLGLPSLNKDFIIIIIIIIMITRDPVKKSPKICSAVQKCIYSG